MLDICQAACQTDNDCIGQLICSDDTTGCTGTESGRKYCVYDGHCSEQYPCIDEREGCGTTQRRRLLQLPGNSVGNPDSSDAQYNEGTSCTRVEYWNDRQVSSFNVITKENTIGGYLVPGRFYESTSGSPDASMTDDDCKLYADEIFAGFGQNLLNPGPGCVVTADKQEVRYNPGSCQHSDQNFHFLLFLSPFS